MATLPDIDTSQVSFIAYWNALNHGVSDIAPDEVTSHSSVQNSVYYDNGVIVTVTNPTGGDWVREFKVRVKEDGWFVAYWDDHEEFGTDVNSVLQGPWEVFGVTPNANPTTVPDNILATRIGDLVGELSNAGSITFGTNDVGLYNYMNDAYSTLTHMAWKQNSASANLRFSYTSGTTIHNLYAYGAVVSDSDSITVDFIGDSTDALLTTVDSPIMGVLEESGNVPSAGTNYGQDVSNSTYNGSPVGVLIGWS